MAAPVTNQNYTQQINQAFDMLKYATPQQMQVVSQQVQQNPNSPEAMALAMAAQYQQQARAPRPQAPQGTILQQKLQEFQQTSPQGLPQVGQNQMAMQQAAQQNPMFGAGLAVAPENTEQAPAPQQMAATGGITALAHGGEVRHFEDGGYFGSFNDYGEEYQKQLQGLIPPPSREEAYGTVLEEDKLKVAKDLAEKKSKEHTGDIGQQIDLTDREQPPIISIPTDNVKDTTAPKGIASLKTKNVDPNQFDQAAANMDMGEEPVKTKYSEAPIGKDDILFAPADTSSAARNQASPTAYQTLEDVMKFRGEEADMSEEVGMAKEYAANARRDKGLGALVATGAGMLSAQTPNIGQAAGAGMLAGLSSYQSGAKEEQAANKDLMALQMASKKSKLQGHREAADIILAEKAAIKLAQANTYSKMTQAQYAENLRRGTKGIEHGYNKELQANKQVAALHNNIVMEMVKAHITPYEAQKSYIALASSMDPTGFFAASNPEKFKTMLDKAYQDLPGNTGSGLGNIGGGQPSGQALGNNISMSTPTQ
jgi:hypothetical protein